MIDFGDVRVLERTPRANIANHACTSEGETIDLVTVSDAPGPNPL